MSLEQEHFQREFYCPEIIFYLDICHKKMYNWTT